LNIENGNIYAWGRNIHWELGNFLVIQFKSHLQVPILIFQKLEKVQKIICSSNFSVILQNGILYSCGENEKGQLGLGDFQERLKFHEVRMDQRVVQFHAKGNHSVMLLGRF
jgi:alpha-tubulin suppressor-like RCC1 family protein